MRAVKDALWHNSVNLAELFGRDVSDMLIDLEIGVQQPDRVDAEALAVVFPYGQVTISVVKGRLDVPRPDGGVPPVIAKAAISISFEV